MYSNDKCTPDIFYITFLSRIKIHEFLFLEQKTISIFFVKYVPYSRIGYSSRELRQRFAERLAYAEVPHRSARQDTIDVSIRELNNRQWNDFSHRTMTNTAAAYNTRLNSVRTILAFNLVDPQRELYMRVNCREKERAGRRRHTVVK